MRGFLKLGLVLAAVFLAVGAVFLGQSVFRGGNNAVGPSSPAAGGDVPSGEELALSEIEMLNSTLQIVSQEMPDFEAGPLAG